MPSLRLQSSSDRHGPRAATDPLLPARRSDAPGVQTLDQPEQETRQRRKHDPLWYVILHDDQLHTYQYVVEMLMKLFKMSFTQAFGHAVEVDTEGVTIVARLPKKDAADKRDQIMSYGGDPYMKTEVSMRASIEPCDD